MGCEANCKCRICYQRKRYSEDPDYRKRKLESNAKWHEENADKVREYKRKYAKKKYYEKKTEQQSSRKKKRAAFQEALRKSGVLSGLSTDAE